ncbi:MAG: ABC transporter permease [Clostridium sp.]|nr:ABC transporter permease [Clostridium sp.]
MKQFKEVLLFEFGGYFKSKSWIITNILLVLAIIIGLSLPSIIDFNGSEDTEKTTYAILDSNNIIENDEILKQYFQNSEWKRYNTEEELNKAIEEEEVAEGFIIKSTTEYVNVVYNSSFDSDTNITFNTLMSNVNRDKYFASKGLDVLEIENIINTPITSEVNVLGKDSAKNFAYTYMLVFIVYMMVIMYGQMIAVSVATEKSNRSMEVLVTSTSSNSLIFGKVIAGAIAGITQVALILSAALITYNINGNAWKGKLDFLLNIPAEVLIVFSIFGLFGYLLYSFLFGGLGALVSKVEDVNKSATPLTMIMVVVFMLVMMNLTEPDGSVMKILSYIPFSSCVAMFVRVGMGTVSVIEIVISAILLIVTTLGAGFIGAKIYRQGTLKYGNPISISTALKSLKKSNKEN